MDDLALILNPEPATEKKNPDRHEERHVGETKNIIVIRSR